MSKASTSGLSAFLASRLRADFAITVKNAFGESDATEAEIRESLNEFLTDWLSEGNEL